MRGAQSVLTLIEREPRAVLATLVGGTGGSSRKLGATMCVGASGHILGAVTIGGCVDARVLAAADGVLATGRGRVLEIALDDDEAWEMGLTCGGTVRVALEPLDAARHESVGVVAVERLLPELLAERRAVVSAFALEGNGTRLLLADGVVVAGTLGDAQLDADAARVAATLVGARRAAVERLAGSSGSREVFLERLAPPGTLVIVGAGEIAVSLTRLARELEMRVVIIDGRERYASPARFPLADEIHVGMPSEIVATFADDPNAAIVLVAHDYKYELPVLRAVLRSRVGYVGMLGSRKRGANVKRMLADEGFAEPELSRVHTPIGVDIGGTSPAEIALAILAEVTAVRNGKLP